MHCGFYIFWLFPEKSAPRFLMIFIPIFIAAILLFALVCWSKVARIIVALFIAVITFWALMPTPAVEKTVERLVQQVKGEQFYWDTNGKEITIWHMTWHEAFEQVYAAKQLGEMGSGAAAALPHLKAEIANGVSNIDTGDGMINLKDAIEQAIIDIEADAG